MRIGRKKEGGAPDQVRGDDLILDQERLQSNGSRVCDPGRRRPTLILRARWAASAVSAISDTTKHVHGSRHDRPCPWPALFHRRVCRRVPAWHRPHAVARPRRWARWWRWRSSCRSCWASAGGVRVCWPAGRWRHRRGPCLDKPGMSGWVQMHGYPMLPCNIGRPMLAAPSN